MLYMTFAKCQSGVENTAIVGVGIVDFIMFQKRILNVLDVSVYWSKKYEIVSDCG